MFMPKVQDLRKYSQPQHDPEIKIQQKHRVVLPGKVPGNLHLGKCLTNKCQNL